MTKKETKAPGVFRPFLMEQEMCLPGESGNCMTKYEKKIYEIINHSREHMTAEQIYARLQEVYPSVVLATVYNNLNKLWSAGLIRKVSVEGMPDRYDKIKKHDHLVCQKCGKLTDIRFPDLTEQLQGEMGDELLFYDLKVFYVCPECRKKSGGN